MLKRRASFAKFGFTSYVFGLDVYPTKSGIADSMVLVSFENSTVEVEVEAHDQRFDIPTVEFSKETSTIESAMPDLVGVHVESEAVRRNPEFRKTPQSPLRGGGYGGLHANVSPLQEEELTPCSPGTARTTFKPILPGR